MKIAVDAMGGDNAPKAIVEGVVLAASEFKDMEFILYGNEEAIKPFLSNE
ncbi:MAG: phosphate acyltransferase, partial [Carnobacterium sp.]